MVLNWNRKNSWSWKQIRAALLAVSVAMPVGALLTGSPVQGQEAATATPDAAKPALNATTPPGTRDLDGAIKSMAETIVKYQEEKKQAISIGDFGTPPGTTSGPAIRDELVKKVEDSGVKLARAGNPNAITIKGDVTRTDPNAEGKVLVKIECRMTDSNGAELGSFREKVIVDKTSDVARLLGVTGEITQTTPTTATGGTTTGAAPSPATPATPPAATPAGTTTPPAATPPATTPPAATPGGTPPAPGATPPAAGTAPAAGTTPGAVTTPVAGDPVAERQRQADALKQALANPTGVAVGGQVAASPTSPFRMQIMIKSSDPGTGKPVYTAPKIEIDGGLAYIDLQKGQEFIVALYNNSAHDVAVELYLDGINSFELSQSPYFKAPYYYIVHRGSSAAIDGWYVTENKKLSFLVADAPDSLAAQRFPDRGTASMGMITALYYYAWSRPEERPAFETEVTKRSRLGIGAGREVQSFEHTELYFKGKSLLAAVTLRYEKQGAPADLPQDALPSNPPKP